MNILDDPKYKPFHSRKLSLANILIGLPIIVFIGIPRFILSWLLFAIMMVFTDTLIYKKSYKGVLLWDLPGLRGKIYRFMYIHAVRMMVHSVGITWIQKKGFEEFYEKRESHAPFVGICNHVTATDALIFVNVLQAGIVAKESVRDTPVVNRYFDKLGLSFVSRTKSNGKEFYDQMLERSKNAKQPLIIFPEATTVSGYQLLKFRTGAFVNGTNIAMFSLKYKSYGLFPWLDMSWTWESGLELLLKFLISPVVVVTVTFHGFYVPNEEEKKNPELLRENCRKKYLELTGFTDSLSHFNDKVEFVKMIRKTDKTGLE